MSQYLSDTVANAKQKQKNKTNFLTAFHLLTVRVDTNLAVSCQVRFLSFTMVFRAVQLLTVAVASMPTFTAAIGEVDMGVDSAGTPGDYAVISGGHANAAPAEATVVGGGEQNTASGPGATVGGGANHLVTGGYSTVAGGIGNVGVASYATVSGGSTNSAIGTYTTIGGGASNAATGDFSSVVGGAFNSATGAGSVAAGTHARVLHDNAFVFGAGSEAPGTTPGDPISYCESKGAQTATFCTNELYVGEVGVMATIQDLADQVNALTQLSQEQALLIAQLSSASAFEPTTTGATGAVVDDSDSSISQTLDPTESTVTIIAIAVSAGCVVLISIGVAIAIGVMKRHTKLLQKKKTVSAAVAMPRLEMSGRDQELLSIVAAGAQSRARAEFGGELRELSEATSKKLGHDLDEMENLNDLKAKETPQEVEWRLERFRKAEEKFEELVATPNGFRVLKMEANAWHGGDMKAARASFISQLAEQIRHHKPPTSGERRHRRQQQEQP